MVRRPHGGTRTDTLFPYTARGRAIQYVDRVALLMDEPIVEVFASASCLIDPRIADLGDVDTAKTVLRTQSGRLCTISNSRRTGYGYDQRIEAFGSRGALSVDNIPRTAVRLAAEPGMRADRIPYAFSERYDAEIGRAHV